MNQALFESLEVPIVVLGSNRHIIAATQGFRRLCPPSILSEDVIGAAVSSVFPKFSAIIERSREEQGAAPRLSLDEAATVFEVDLDDSRWGLIVTLRDVTKLIRVEKDAKTFAHHASHDLRAPLRIVRSFVELLAEDLKGSMGGESVEYMRHITDNTRRMQHLVDDLLIYSRLVRCDVKREVVALDAVLEEVVELVPAASGCIHRGPLTTVFADHSLLVRLLRSLIENSVRFQSSARPLVINVDAEHCGGRCRVTVKDNGVGFDNCFADQIFEPFRRLDAHSENSGSGMGLTFAKVVADLHGGQIGAIGWPGEGATFWFSIPAMEQSDDA